MSKKEALKKISELVRNYKENEKEFLARDYKENWVEIHFIIPFFKALGWNFEEGKSYLREVFTQDSLLVLNTKRAPDYGFSLPGNDRRLFYVEAKTPAEKLKTEHDPAYQLRRYGRSGETAVSILFNFKEFAVYDCTQKQTKTSDAKFARMKYFTCDEYVENFDYIYDTFSREAAHNGNFENYIKDKTKQKGNVSLDKDFVESLNVWRLNLAKSIAKNNHKLNEEDVNLAVQLLLDRIIFLRFCEERDVEPYGQLEAVAKHKHTYKHLFDLFGVADQKYNAGIFDFKKDQITEKLDIDDGVIKGVLEDLYPPKSDYAFAVMPVEILGNAYEQFLGNVIRITSGHNVRIQLKEEVRKAGGVYYTPQYIVDYIVDKTVGKLINGKSPKEIEKIKIVDPACGSGSFLLGAYKYLINYHIKWYYTQNKKSSKLNDNGTLTTDEKRKILTNNIFGVDLDTNAVEVSKLSLLLKCMEGETASSVKQQIKMYHTRVLPNIDKNIVNGNSLIGFDFTEGELKLDEKRKTELEHKVKPFDWKVVFPEVFKEGGFDVVVGNPPYVMLQILDTKEVFSYCLRKFQSAKYKIDTYQLFIEQSVILLKDGGLLGFITPNTFLKNIHSEPLRKYALDNTLIREVILFKYSVFESASVDTCVFVFEKGKSKPNTQISVKEAESAFKLKIMPSVKQNVFNSNNRKDFNLLITESDTELLNKIIKSSDPLSSFCNAYFGIQTFDRNRFVSDKKLNKHYEKVIDGANIDSFYLKEPNEYVNYQPSSIKSGGNELIYKQERICIRQIGAFPISTIVPANIFTLNTIYNVYLNNKNKLDLRIILGIINSNVIRFFWKKNNSDEKKTFPKIKKEAILSIPIPKFNTTIQKKHGEDILKNTNLLLKLNIELRETKLQTKVEQIKQRIKYSENQINDLVYKLYDITAVEKGIIEG
jgi:type I restriction-modification system DNA methylase subunit